MLNFMVKRPIPKGFELKLPSVNPGAAISTYLS